MLRIASSEKFVAAVDSFPNSRDIATDPGTDHQKQERDLKTISDEKKKERNARLRLTQMK